MPIMSKETYELAFKSKASGATPESDSTLDNCQVKLSRSKSKDTNNYKQASSLEPKSSAIADTKSVESTTSFFSKSDKTSNDPSSNVKSLNDLPPCSKGDLIDDKTKTILCKKFGYEIGDKLGSGAYGEVSSAIYLFAIASGQYSFAVCVCRFTVLQTAGFPIRSVPSR